MSAPRIVIVTFDAAQILDVTGPLEVFSTASRYLESATYRTEVVTTTGGVVTASCGLDFASSRISEVRGPVDTLGSVVEARPSSRSPRPAGSGHPRP